MVALALLSCCPAFFIGPEFTTANMPIVLPVYLMAVLLGKAIPGVLASGCGWGWCAPTVFGWSLSILVWMGMAWWIAGRIVRWRSKRTHTSAL